jgi:hypothetical protein
MAKFDFKQLNLPLVESAALLAYMASLSEVTAFDKSARKGRRNEDDGFCLCRGDLSRRWRSLG